jgi:hypothetical protein
MFTPHIKATTKRLMSAKGKSFDGDCEGCEIGKSQFERVANREFGSPIRDR